MTHPLTIGTRIRTIGGAAQGDWDSFIDDKTDQDVERRTSPGEIGEIVDSHDHGFRADATDFHYQVVFHPSGVWVSLGQQEIDDAAKYEVLPTIEDELEQLVTNYKGVMEEYDAGFPITREDHPHNEDWLKASALIDWLAARRKAEAENTEDPA